MILAIGIFVFLAAVVIAIAWIARRRSQAPVDELETIRAGNMECQVSTAQASTDQQLVQPDVVEPGQIEPALVTETSEQSASGTSGTRKTVTGSPFENTRQFQRSDFRGNAMATIYDLDSRRGREPQRYTVATRDLSCGGIGISHTEQLFPKQLIVIELFGKHLLCQVRWCRRVEARQYFAGCEFVPTESEDSGTAKQVEYLSTPQQENVGYAPAIHAG